MAPVTAPFGTLPEMRVGVVRQPDPSMAAMRLAQKYGAEFIDTPIVSYFWEGEGFIYPSIAAKVDGDGDASALNMQSIGHGPVVAMMPTGTRKANTTSSIHALADQIRHYFNGNPIQRRQAGQEWSIWIGERAVPRWQCNAFAIERRPGRHHLTMLTQAGLRPVGAPHFISGTNYAPDGSNSASRSRGPCLSLHWRHADSSTAARWTADS
jgi:hypothetical protein